MVYLRLMQIINRIVIYFNYAYLIRLIDVTKPTKWPLPLQSICKHSNANNFPIFQPILIKLVSKCMVYRALSYKHTHIRVAVLFNLSLMKTILNLGRRFARSGGCS